MTMLSSQTGQSRARPRLPQGLVSLGNIVKFLCKTPTSAFGLVVFAALVITAIVGPFVAPYDPYAQDLQATLQAPSAAHWFGTDELGRDILSRLLHGAASTLAALSRAMRVRQRSPV